MSRDQQLGHLRITLLMDHQAVRPDLWTEHGLAFFVEQGAQGLLFDTGASQAFAHNAHSLGLDLSSTRHIVLSHGHWDHTGGLQRALQEAPKASVVLHPRALGPRFSLHPGRPVRELSFPKESYEAVCPLLHEVHWSTAGMHLGSGLGVTGPIPRRYEIERLSGPFFLDRQGQHPDPLEDDQALWIQTEAGLVVLLGCAHAGLVNTLEQVIHLSGESTIHAIFGGFHLLHADAERLEFTLEALKRLGVEKLFPCHCTGQEALLHLKRALGSRVREARCGDQWTWPLPQQS